MDKSALVLPDNRCVALDKDGYLRNMNDWDADVADALAGREDITLTPAHWEVIDLVRQFYLEFGLSPATRPLVKYTSLHLGADKGKSMYLMKLFGGKPALTISRLAGLPRPANCF
ncbi:MAG: TusE/DsrC/DsvC family sulfur relay protein [Pseudohongiella sp.]|uniref:TusE/DsrC/DsvC family sulfur relay protein n=1 Tax=Pseudohongiella sp. TaxID=1979412 RepID=UPI00349FE524